MFDGEMAQGHGPKVQFREGFCNLMLGPEDVEGRALNEGLQGPDVYLELKAKDGAVMGTRQKIISAAFALKAKQAEMSQNATKAVEAEMATTASVADKASGLIGSDGQSYGWETVFDNGDPSTGNLDVKGTVRADSFYSFSKTLTLEGNQIGKFFDLPAEESSVWMVTTINSNGWHCQGIVYCIHANAPLGVRFESFGSSYFCTFQVIYDSQAGHATVNLKNEHTTAGRSFYCNAIRLDDGKKNW